MKSLPILLIFTFFIILSFAIPFGYATISRGPGGGAISSIPYPSPPSFSFNPISVPSFSINWSLNPLQDIENIIDAIPNFVLGFIGANLINFFLYVLEAIYYFFAYLEYFIIIGALNASVNLGIWALPMFVGILTLLVSLVVMILKVSEGVILIGGM
jgi:hypothetical protein